MGKSWERGFGVRGRIYIVDKGVRIVEVRWRYGWLEPRILAVDGVPSGKIAVVQAVSSDADLELRVYYSSDRKNVVNELVYNGGVVAERNALWPHGAEFSTLVA